MYHRIVAAKLRKAFADINAGNWQSMVDTLAPDFTYVFYGEHALSGERHTVEAMSLWWQRVFRLIPDAGFEPLEIVISGGPWLTKVATRVRIGGPLPDGTRYDNIMTQFMYLKWGRITEIHTLEDTVVLQRALDSIAASGNAEAHAEPITDAYAARSGKQD
ncbi:nuclear transport factor 2 family protein [Streptomyces sp. Qhu-G9]|uniref:nuclear transport factor 2 family protein n=1 Tax=Streptomyces sp. Qhu-G9 TaxID=3452799 RepID=UPI0022AC89FF|nr:nuclear transport factor 2 family protein [Streptomyces aurantiacus]WAU85147.1 nuclear transport factor 2 family protein [Streptomyces aurantiacus]